MHVDDVTGVDGIAAGWRLGRNLGFAICRIADFLDRLFAEAAQGELGFLGIAIIKHGSDEIARMAIGAFDEHGPDIGFA